MIDIYVDLAELQAKFDDVYGAVVDATWDEFMALIEYEEAEQLRWWYEWADVMSDPR